MGAGVSEEVEGAGPGSERNGGGDNVKGQLARPAQLDRSSFENSELSRMTTNV